MSKYILFSSGSKKRSENFLQAKWILAANPQTPGEDTVAFSRGGAMRALSSVALDWLNPPSPLPLFTCGRRPAGLLATLVVVVVVVVGGVVGGGGGISFIHGYWENPCMVLKKMKVRSYIFVIFHLFLFQKPMYGLNAHVWS